MLGPGGGGVADASISYSPSDSLHPASGHHPILHTAKLRPGDRGATCRRDGGTFRPRSAAPTPRPGLEAIAPWTAPPAPCAGLQGWLAARILGRILRRILLTASAFPLLSCPLPLLHPLHPSLLSPSPQPPLSKGAVESSPDVREVMSAVAGRGWGGMTGSVRRDGGWDADKG